MSQYCYSALSPGANNVRLLRLMPCGNESTERSKIECKLFEYSLQDLGKRTHLYEALSYTWDGEEKPCSITIEERNLDVTRNLYVALLHLRDRCLERIIWIDAICINQKSPEERGQQVRIMAMIYSKAHRVIVWLGETADGVEGALEDIQHAANEESTECSNKKMNQKAIVNLLQRPWFRRIWVLQEIAAARHVIMMCGSMEIDGFAFCLGLKSLWKSQELSHAAFPDSQSLPSLTNLIERAALRPKHTKKSLGRYSLQIRPLAELVDMFHTRQASDPRDKVYALLGMSSDDLSKASLQPDYKISWENLSQQFVNFVLGKGVFVETSSNQRMVIKSKGCILGQVSSVERGDRQTVNIKSRNGHWNLGNKTEWTLQASAKPIQKHDIVCLLDGASKPTIIRLCKDHFAVIVSATTPLNRSQNFGWSELSQLTTQFLRDFLLVWDWEDPQGKSQDQEEYKTLTKTYSQAFEYPKAEFMDYLDEAARLWNDIMILDDLGEYEEADERLLKARSGYVTAFRKEHLPKPNSQCGRTLLSFVAGEGYEDTAKVLLETIHPDLKDGKSGRTPLSWAAENGYEAVVKLLLETGKVDVGSKNLYGQTPLSWAAGNGHETVVKLLLGSSKVDINSKNKDGRSPLSCAARNGREAVVKLLLETGKVDVDSKDENGRTPLSWAAQNGHKAVIKLLLNTGKVDADSKDRKSQTPLSWAAQNGHEAVVKLLLNTGKVNADSKDRDSQTPLSWAAQNGHEAVIKLLLNTGKVNVDSKDMNNQTPLSSAAQNGHEAVVKLLLNSGKVNADSKSGYGWTPLSWAARNGHEAVVKLLLKTGKVDANLKDIYGRTPLLLAAEYRHETVVKLLLHTGKVDVNSKDKDDRTPLLWAAKQGHESVVKLMLETGKVDTDLKDIYGQTPLLLAAEKGHEAIVKLLLENGKVDANLKDIYGQTPLLLAAKNGHETVVKLLFETGKVDVNSKDKDCRMPLLWAAGKGHEAVVKLLLNTGKVGVNSEDGYGQTPLSLAAENGHEAVVKLLLETGKVNVDSKDRYGRTPLSLATLYEREAVIRLLSTTV